MPGVVPDSHREMDRGLGKPPLDQPGEDLKPPYRCGGQKIGQAALIELTGLSSRDCGFDM